MCGIATRVAIDVDLDQPIVLTVEVSVHERGPIRTVIGREQLLDLLPTVKTRRSPPDVLADARRVIAANDRELALQLLLKICSGGERTASQLPEAIAEALVATARRQQDDNGRTVLQAHTDGSIAREEIVSLIGGAPLASDDLAAIRVALDERQRRDQLAEPALGRGVWPRWLGRLVAVRRPCARTGGGLAFGLA